MAAASYVTRISPLIALWMPTPESIEMSAGGGAPASIACCNWITHCSDVGSAIDSTSTSVSFVNAGYILAKFSSKNPP